MAVMYPQELTNAEIAAIFIPINPKPHCLHVRNEINLYILKIVGTF